MWHLVTHISVVLSDVWVLFTDTTGVFATPQSKSKLIAEGLDPEWDRYYYTKSHKFWGHLEVVNWPIFKKILGGRIGLIK